MSQRAVFIDRDGTLIHDRHYLGDPEGVELLDGAAEAVRTLQGAGLAVIVVTNQSGIGRGLFTEEDYRAVARQVDVLLGLDGVSLDGSYHCPHDPSSRCACRKPGTALYEEAAKAQGLTLPGSYYVGDRAGDVEPATTLDGTGLLVRTGHGHRHEEEVCDWAEVVDDLAEAARKIVALERR